MRVWSLNRNALVLNPVERLQELFSSIHSLSLESFRRELETHLTELRKPTWWPFLLDSLACDVFPYSDLSNLPFEKAAIFRPQTKKFRNARELARDSILSAIVHAQADLDAWPSSSLSYPRLGDRARRRALVQRGLAELENLHGEFGVT